MNSSKLLKSSSQQLKNIPVNGLILSNIDVRDIQTNVRLLLAIRKRDIYLDFSENSERTSKKMSTFFELGISYASAEKGLFKFNNISEEKTCNPLLEKISDMIATNYSKVNTEDDYIPNFKNANIIIRKYDNAGIGHHKDKIDELFEPIVFTLVVKNESKLNGCLNFKSDDNTVKYVVPEKDGTIIIMQDESLYNFTHGVNPSNGVRISVTVRFFREDKLTKLLGYNNTKKMTELDIMTRNKIINYLKKKDNEQSSECMSIDKELNSMSTKSSCDTFSDNELHEFFSFKPINDQQYEEILLSPNRKSIERLSCQGNSMGNEILLDRCTWVSKTNSPNGFHRKMLLSSPPVSGFFSSGDVARLGSPNEFGKKMLSFLLPSDTNSSIQDNLYENNPFEFNMVTDDSKFCFDSF